MKTAIHNWYYSDSTLSKLTRTSYRKVVSPVRNRVRQRILEKRTTKDIAEVAEILYRHKCTWSLQTGNVLGIFRDSGYLKNEADVDWVVLAEMWHVQIEDEIRQQGFDVSTFCGGYEEGSEGVHITLRKRGMIFDIYPAFKDIWDGVAYRWYGGDYTHRYYFYPKLLEETHSVDFYGVAVEIPKDTDQYLRAVYGDDYMVPNPNWDWRTEPKCRLALSPTYLSQADVDLYLNSTHKKEVDV